MVGSFIPNTFQCDTSEISFFRSANYAASSFTRSWATRTVPDTEGNDTPVYLLVLQKFNVPTDFSNGTPPGGTLPGIDIRRMGAINAIRLSLAESLTQGQWWDVYEDGEGGVFFQNVVNEGGPGKTINLDVRFCVATSKKENEIDIVVVRGYDPPPERFVRDFKDVVPAGTGEINPSEVTGDEKVFTVSPSSFVGTSSPHQKVLADRVYKSYKDPVFTDVYKGQEPNPFYSVKENESLIGYVVDIDGMPEDPVEAARIKVSYTNTTIWYQEIDFPQFNMTDTPSTSVGLPTGSSINYFEGIHSYTTPLYNDRYGTPWPLVLRPAGVYFTGNALDNISTYGSLAYFYIEPVPLMAELSGGSDWAWNRPDALSYEIGIYYQPHEDPSVWESLVNLSSSSITSKILYNDGRPFEVGKGESYTFSSRDVKILGSKSSLGYLVDKLFVAWEIDRPSVVIEDKLGDALTYAQNLRVRYAPIVIYDPEAPIAYYHKDEGGKIVDQTSGLQDNDPTTCQNFEESDLEKMNDLSQGQVIDTTLPFCESGEVCLKVARTIFDYMTVKDAQTYTLTCGPDSEPELGAAVAGYDSNLRIESINYSFQDGSSYTIEVSLGPVFSNIGSWNAGAWVRKTQDVSREAVVRWTAGDGVNYLVEVRGLGSFYAVNTVTEGVGLFYPGDIVSVTLKNVPIEE